MKNVSCKSSKLIMCDDLNLKRHYLENLNSDLWQKAGHFKEHQIVFLRQKSIKLLEFDS